jgi:hypothetical protein
MVSSRMTLGLKGSTKEGGMQVVSVGLVRGRRVGFCVGTGAVRGGMW